MNLNITFLNREYFKLYKKGLDCIVEEGYRHMFASVYYSAGCFAIIVGNMMRHSMKCFLN